RGGRAGVHASVRGARGPDGQPGHAAGGAGGGPQSGDPGCALPERPALPGPGGGGGAPAGDRPPGGEVDGGHRGLRPGRGPCVPSRGRPRFPTRGHGARPRLGRGWLSAGSEWTCPPRAPPRAPVFGENMESLIVTGAIAVGALALGWLVGWWAERLRLRRAKASAEDEAARIRRAAEQDAERIRKAAELEGKEAAYRAKQEWEREEARRREELERIARRLEERQSSLDRKYDILDEKEQELEERERELQDRLADVERQAAANEQLAKEARHRLEQLAGMTAEEAKRQLMQDMEEEARAEASKIIREIKENARREAEREARNIIALAIQRIAADHTAECTVSVVSLPSDEMKGRIIGREGRNIRAFEQATGIDVIIDDTPEAVILSGFDPIRRETARISLEKLIADGRIHPGRIEEVVAKSRKEVEEMMIQAAEEVLYSLGIHGVHPEIVKVLGRLRF